MGLYHVHIHVNTCPRLIKNLASIRESVVVYSLRKGKAPSLPPETEILDEGYGEFEDNFCETFL